jgi:branched-chain amino acid transport system substrate-binding protein
VKPRVEINWIKTANLRLATYSFFSLYLELKTAQHRRKKDMRMNSFSLRIFTVLILGGLILAACARVPAASDTVRIGINAELTGDIPKVGEAIKFAAEMFRDEINAAGGVDIGGQKYLIELVIEDNNGTAEGAAAAAEKLISQGRVLVMVGPNPSSAAIPAAEVADASKIPMISPWSTNPRTTEGRPWVFRAPFLDPFQGPVVANFVTEEFGAAKAAVLYNVGSDYPKGLAEFFRNSWEGLHGPGSIVAFETFTTGDQDFSAQLTKIRDSGADILFTPQYYNEVPLIVDQARNLGMTMPIVGSDSWGDPQTLELCGATCEGAFFSTHYVAAGATGITKDFIDKYNSKFGYVPSDVGALSWDSMGIVVQALQNCGNITGNLEQDRACIRDGMAAVKDFKGVTGDMSFDEEGDPIKCAVIVQIRGDEFVAYKMACP